MEELAKLEEERGNPAGIIAPAIVATFISTLTTVVYCKGRIGDGGFEALRLCLVNFLEIFWDWNEISTKRNRGDGNWD